MNASSRKANSVMGYQLTLFTQQDRRHRSKSLGQWLVEERVPWAWVRPP